MSDLPVEIKAEIDNVEQTLTLLNEAISRKKKTGVELSAMGACLQSTYNGIENILKQILKIKGVSIPHSSTWHKDLLNLAILHSIITADLADKLFEYLGFRHFFVHSYSFKLNADIIQELSKELPGVWENLVSSVKTITW